MENICIGPYAPKQKLYIETEDGDTLEGEFFKFNNLKTAITLHRVGKVPPDGRTFDQLELFIADLVCLRPLAPQGPTPVVNQINKNDELKHGSKQVQSPETLRSGKWTENKEESTPRPLSKHQMILEALKRHSTWPNNVPEQTSAEASSGIQSNSKENVCNGDSAKISSKDPPKSSSTLTSDTTRPKLNVRQPEEPTRTEVTMPVVTDAVYEEMKQKALGHIMINKLGPDFQAAMKNIEQQDVLGISSHGAEQGRRGRLSLITVATDKSVYLVDIQSLGKQALQTSLRRALENPAILKVVHDCKLLADCLLHSHALKVENVFDVQAADCIINRCRTGRFLGRGRSLQELVSQYLKLPAALLTNTVNITNYKVWYQRPLPSGFGDFAAWQVVFLPKLRIAIDKAYLAPLLNSFDVYLNSLRSLDRSAAIEAQSKRRQLPVELLEAPFSREN